MHMEVRDMERYASNLKMKEIKRLASENQFMKAMQILETLNVDKIRSVSDLSMIAEVLVSNEHYDDAMEILLRIYEKSCTRRIVEQLIDLCIKMKNFEEIGEYYKEYVRIAARDPYRYVLKYRIQKAKHAPYSERIETLEKLKHEDYMEEWGYELAKLYHKTGQTDKCVEECSDIILWFGKGIIVEKARLLKEHYISGFDITDNLKPGEFDATISLEDVIRQVKGQRTVASLDPLRVDQLEPSNVISLNDIDRTVSTNQRYNNDALYLNSESAANKVGLDSEQLEKVLSEDQVGKMVLDTKEDQISNINDYNYEVKQEVDQEADQEVDQEVNQEVDQEADQEADPEVEQETELETVQETEQEVKEASAYVLTPEVIKEVQARVNATQNSIQNVTAQEDSKESSVEKPADSESESEEDTVQQKALTDEELKKMKERMQQLQSEDIVKTYRHDSDEITEENGITYAYGINLNAIFQNFIENESLKNQLCSILKNMDNSKMCNHFLICGDVQSGKTSLARAISITMWKLNRIPTKKVAKIHASKLNSIDLLAKMEPLANGSIVIEDASMLETATIRSILEMIEHFNGNILVFLEDQTRNMEELLAREEVLRTFFTHRIIIPRYNAKDLMGFALDMIKQQEYEIDEQATEFLEAKIEQIGKVTPSREQLGRIKEYITSLTQKAETRNMLLLMQQAKEGKFAQRVNNIIIVDDIID